MDLRISHAIGLCVLDGCALRLTKSPLVAFAAAGHFDIAPKQPRLQADYKAARVSRKCNTNAFMQQRWAWHTSEWY